MITGLDRRLIYLALFHILFGMGNTIFAGVAADWLWTPFYVLVCASTACQAILLSVWIAFSSSSIRKRTTGAVAGVACVQAPYDLYYEPAGLPFDFFRLFELPLIILSVGISLAILTFLMFRALGVRLVYLIDTLPPVKSETIKPRFSLKTLMLIVAVVAVLLAGWRQLNVSLLPTPFLFPGAPFFLLHDELLLGAAVLALCFVISALVTFWAAMGYGRPLKRGCIAVALSALFGPYIGVSLEMPPSAVACVSSYMIIYSVMTLGSLLFVRRSGYYFVLHAEP